MDRKVEQTSALEWQFIRDKSGRMRRMLGPGGKETVLDYEFFPGKDGQTRLATIRFPGGQVEHEYDQRGRITRVSDQTGEIHYDWDQFGRIRSVGRSIGPRVVYRYTPLGRLKGYSLGPAFEVGYEYDFLGRIAEIKTPVGVIRYEFLAGLGKAIRTLPNRTRTIWDHEPDGRLVAITHVDSRDRVIGKFTYTHRPGRLIGQVLEMSPRGEKRLDYGYDAVQRLVSVSDSTGPGWRFEYDARGNCTKEINDDGSVSLYRYDWAGRLIEVDREACVHDASGNLTLARVGGVLRRFAFDHGNRICGADPGGTRYEHDGEGCLIARICGTERTAFIPDPSSEDWRPLAELSPNGRQRFYVYGDRGPLATVENGVARFFLHDHAGSVRCVADDAGNMVDWRDYSAFGVLEGGSAGLGLTPGFAGMFWDPAACLYLTRNRAYSPQLGRFLQIDPLHRVPLGSQKELSAYVYCGDDPLNYTDSIGLTPQPIHGGSDEHGGLGGRYAGGDGEKFGRLVPQPPAGRGANGGGHGAFDPLHPGRKSGGDGPAIGGGVPGGNAASSAGPGSGGDQGESHAAQGSSASDVLARASNFLSPIGSMVNYEQEYWSEMAERADAQGNWLLGSVFDLEAGLAGGNERGQAWAGILASIPFPEIKGAKILLSVWGYLNKVAAISGLGADFAGHDYGKAIYDVLAMLAEPVFKFSDAARNAAAQSLKLADSAALLGLAKFEQRFLTHGSHMRWLGDISHPVGFALLAPGLVEQLKYGLGIKEAMATPAVSAAGDKQQNGSGPGSRKLHVGARNLQDAGHLKHWKTSYLPPWFQFPPWLWNPVQGNPPDPRTAGAAIETEGWPPGRSGVAAHLPSPVGGVYLGGAGAMLKGVGQITGIATDGQTGSLTLLTEQQGGLELPFLRLDDVVVVFRSVYVHGQGPSVTINPRAENPEGPWMDVVLGAATSDTYVGWVLFQADRIMKTYNLGQDNLTRNPVSSGVAGYDDLLDVVFFGGDFSKRRRLDGQWERFWIVPSQVTRFQSSSLELSLIDVPLEVKSQRVVFRNGKLEDEPNERSSRGAMAFIEWLTRSYEGIAAERYLQPPPETGLDAPVPIFGELKRIASITAVAELLRDRGISMPLWMRDYEVKRIPVPGETPAMTIAKTKASGNGTVQAHIYGGVNLSPANEVIRHYDRQSDLRRLLPSHREAYTRQLNAVEKLAPEVKTASRLSPMLAPFPIEHGERQIQAIVLPGSDSLALLPCRLDEVDLCLPIKGGGELALTRRFNSFFQPRGPWGKGWTEDYPRLAEVKLPVERTDKHVRFKLNYELSTPLGEIHARFSEVRHVPELGADLYVPDSVCEVLALAGSNDPIVMQGKTKAILNDGRVWFFDGNGNLVGERRQPFTTVYLRGPAGEVDQMIAYHGDQLEATVQLAYDAEGRLQSAESLNPPCRVTYVYNSEGQLASATNTEERIYTYDCGLVKTVSLSAQESAEGFEKPVLLKSFSYRRNGQLVDETSEGSRVSYSVHINGGRQYMTIVNEDGSQGTSATYDALLRPEEVVEPDGMRTTWDYAPDGAVTRRTNLPDGEFTTTSLSGDRRQRTTETSDGLRLQEEFDGRGRLLNVAVNQQPVLQQKWRTDGLLESVRCEACRIIPQYDPFGRVRSILQVQPEERDRFSIWQKREFDEAGRLTAVKDYSGSDTEVRYDAHGNIAGLTAQRPGENVACSILRNRAGKVEQIHSSWGDEERAYGVNGGLEQIVVRQGFCHGPREIQPGPSGDCNAFRRERGSLRL